MGARLILWTTEKTGGHETARVKAVSDVTPCIYTSVSQSRILQKKFDQ